MREIKFRLTVVRPNGHIFHGDFDIENMMGGVVLSWVEQNHVNLDNVKFRQYTGIKDEGGKEVYEGDVVKVRDATYLNPHEVRWNQCHYEINQEDDGHGNPNTELLEDWAGFIDIIGNIYENPELLRDRYKETTARRGGDS